MNDWVIMSDSTERSLKQFVLINRRTAELMLGTRITLFDLASSELDSELYGEGAFKIMLVSDDSYHGWIIEHPVSELPWFMNRESEKFFEILGEL